MLSLITPTGDRPLAFSICEELMAHQTYTGPVRWIIVDDGRQAQPIGFRRKDWTLVTLRLPAAVGNTQARNLAAAMEVIGPDDRVLICEDDDFYAPTYLEEMDLRLRDYDLVGLAETPYYNVTTRRGKVMGNSRHASLCSTGMKGPALDIFRDVLNTHRTGIDMALWRECVTRAGKPITCYLFRRPELCVGIKGLPGRPGIGVGHRPQFGIPVNLRDWIGNAARFYGA